VKMSQVPCLIRRRGSALVPQLRFRRGQHLGFLDGAHVLPLSRGWYDEGGVRMVGHRPVSRSES
jgi:hypothetical protein